MRGGFFVFKISSLGKMRAIRFRPLQKGLLHSVLPWLRAHPPGIPRSTKPFCCARCRFYPVCEGCLYFKNLSGSYAENDHKIGTLLTGL